MKITAVVDMQFGSTGKGLMSGYLARKYPFDAVVTAWAPNAGHTFVDAFGKKTINIAFPTSASVTNIPRVFIGPGSVINPELLMMEMDLVAVSRATEPMVHIHEHAAVVSELNRGVESTYGYKIGSTMKGVGEATIQKIARMPDEMNIAGVRLIDTPLEKYLVSHSEYINMMLDMNQVLIEGAQGYSLGINSGFYPYTTSRECTIWQLMSDCAIPRMGVEDIHVIGVARTYPIRVANRKDPVNDFITYTSGPCYPDQSELTWADIGVEPELTTVTKLPRRVFGLSLQQLREAAQMNYVNEIFLNFANYVRGEDELLSMINNIEVATGVPVSWLGYGPREDQIKRRA